MAVCTPLSPQEACPPPAKRRRFGWDVPDTVLLAEAARLQFHLASQLLQVLPSSIPSQDNQHTVSSKEHDEGKAGTQKISRFGSEIQFREDGKHCLAASSPSPPWRTDDEDGHLNFAVGDILNSRYKILQKMGEGTFGRVLECWDQEALEVVAIKVVRSPEKYREAAMIEIDHLQTLAKSDNSGSWGKAHKFFKRGRELNWPDKYTLRESIRAVDRLPKLRDLLQRHVEKLSSSFLNLLEGMFCYDPSERLTAREALHHPFFQGSME